MSRICVHGYVSGRVQGVWFRGFVQDRAQQYQLQGWAKNLPDGRVEVLLCGAQQAIGEAIKSLHKGPPLARVDDIDIRLIDYDDSVVGFRIL